MQKFQKKFHFVSMVTMSMIQKTIMADKKMQK